jgi:hypothetical protein
MPRVKVKACDYDKYWTFGTLKHTLNVSEYVLLKYVSNDLIRILIRPGYTPRYCLEDVQKCLMEEYGYDRVPPKGGRNPCVESYRKSVASAAK